MILGIKSTHSNVSFVLDEQFQDKDTKPRIPRPGFIGYLWHNVIQRWETRIGAKHELMTLDAQALLNFFQNTQHCSDIFMNVTQKIYIKRVSLRDSEFIPNPDDPFLDFPFIPNPEIQPERSARSVYVATLDVGELLKEEWVYFIDEVSGAIGPGHGLEDFLNELANSINNLNQLPNLLGISQCKRGFVEGVAIHQDVQQCGMGSVLATLCFNDDKTKEEHGRDLEHDPFWTEITNERRHPETYEHSTLIRNQMQDECQTIVRLNALTPQNTPGGRRQENKAFLYAAVAARYQILVVWGRSVEPSLTYVTSAALSRLHCSPRVRLIGTHNLLSSYTENRPTRILDIEPQYSFRWSFYQRVAA